MGTAKKAVIRVLGEILFEASCFLLHIHAPVTENVAENVGEQLHEGNTLFLLAVAFLQERSNTKITNKSGDCFRNFLFIFVF